MPSRTSKFGSRSIAAGGILAAGSLVMLWFACIAPSGRIGLAAVAGLFPMVSVLAAGRSAGYLCWIASGLLGMLLLPDKGIAFFYLVFLGGYPVVKGHIESIRKLCVEWILKLFVFNLGLTLVRLCYEAMFLSIPLLASDASGLLLYGLGNGVFLIYDFGLSRLVGLIQYRLGYGRRRDSNP
ncbi:MAG: hypothetical protein ACOX7N_05145 [Lawsonibacter sp.]|jgi:hypothetical protein